MYNQNWNVSIHHSCLIQRTDEEVDMYHALNHVNGFISSFKQVKDKEIALQSINFYFGNSWFKYLKKTLGAILKERANGKKPIFNMIENIYIVPTMKYKLLSSLILIFCLTPKFLAQHLINYAIQRGIR